MRRCYEVFEDRRYDLVFESGVFQYLSPSTVTQHLTHVRNMLEPTGIALLAYLPYKHDAAQASERRFVDFLGEHEGARRGAPAPSSCGRTDMGRWGNGSEIAEYAAGAGFFCSFYASMQFQFRFHVIITLRL